MRQEVWQWGDPPEPTLRLASSGLWWRLGRKGDQPKEHQLQVVEVKGDNEIVGTYGRYRNLKRENMRQSEPDWLIHNEVPESLQHNCRGEN